MSYNQTTSELFDLQRFAIKLGLYNISTLSSYNGNPHLKYPTIHIAGTNGKGSTAFYISKMLQTCGLKVGLFTSPHLVDFRERIRINDDLIEKEYVVNFWKDVKNAVLNLKATFFDTITLMAFNYFADHNVDVAVFETGLGGRLDSTNILKSEYVVLTPLGFDHQKQLGYNLTSIATEKAGIIKKESVVFSSRQKTRVLNFFKSKTINNRFYYLPDCFNIIIEKTDLDGIEFKLVNKQSQEEYSFKIPTIATYQTENISLAFLTVKSYCDDNKIILPINTLKKMIDKTTWPGRLQIIQKNPHIFFDVSHNLSGIKKTIDALFKLIQPNQTDLLLGIVNDKDTRGITKFLSGKFRKVIVTEPETLRKQDGEFLYELFVNQGQSVKFIKDLSTAYDICKNNLNINDSLVALGSHYLVGTLMRSG